MDAERAARRDALNETFGPRGFGHVQDRSAVVEPEAAAIRDAARRVLAGETLSSVVRDWNARGLCSTNGKPWRVNSLSALLIQPRLAGLRVDGSGAPVQKWPAIVDLETHERLVKLRASRRPKRRPPQRSLLSGMLRCGRCDGRLHFLYRSEANQYYRCPAPAAGGCSGVIVKARLIEDTVRNIVAARVDSREFLEMAADLLGPDTPIGDELRSVLRAIEDDTARLRELARLWTDGSITRAEWQQARSDIARHLDANESRRLEIESMKAVLGLAGNGRAVAAQWAGMDADVRRQLIAVVVDHVVVDPVGGTGGKFRPERVRPVWPAG